MDIRSSSSSSYFPWALLPVEIQSRILYLLPISTLLRCSAASRSLRRLIRSPSFTSSYPNPNQPLFLFSDGKSPVADAYDPLLDRWLPLPLPLPPSTYTVHCPSGHLLLASEPSSDLPLIVFNPLSSSSPPVEIPNTAKGFYPRALISSGDRDFKILTVSTAGHRIQSRIFDSVTGKWTMGVEFAGFYTSISSCAILNGVFYCLTFRIPMHLLALDPVGGVWKSLDVNLPASCLHKVLVFDGRLFLVGTVAEAEAEAGDFVSLGIWEMNWVRMEFEIYCYMPEEYSDEFMNGIYPYQIGHRNGTVCFISTDWDGISWIVMCTLEGKRWWRPRGQEERKSGMRYCLVCEVEPYIDLVKGSE